MSDINETEVEDEVEREDEPVPFKYSITSYGADYPIDGLVKRLGKGSIFIPGFQRGFVWNIKEASRFIESLLLGLPVPGIFLAKEQDTEKLLVIDGQQRLRTLQGFYKGVFPGDSKRVFSLRGVQKEYEGCTYDSLSEENQRLLDDTILHATIVKQEEPSEDNSSIYHIFERLNTGGVQLQPQEIRACIFHGEFSDLLKKLNKNKSWREVYGPVSKNMKDIELILRFFSLYFKVGQYKKPMKEFLNVFMGKNRHLKIQREEQLTKLFEGTIGVVNSCLGSNAFRPNRVWKAAVFDAVMVGIATRLEKGAIENSNSVLRQYQKLLEDVNFLSACDSATTDEENVNRRINLATQTFSGAK